MNTRNLQWPLAVPGGLISSNEVHVWRVFIDTSHPMSKSLLGTLSDDELTRAGQFHFERDQNRYIRTRGILRKILSHYLGKEPHELSFEYTSHGKPVLINNGVGDSLSFNLSHSGELALYAITRTRKIGIDVERLRDDLDTGLIAQKFFSTGEINSLDRIHTKNRREVFFQYWARKEALMKASGEGISFPMEQCDVSVIDGNSFSPIVLPGKNRESPCWHIQDLFPGDGYAAAIAVEGGDCNLSCCHYSVWGK